MSLTTLNQDDLNWCVKRLPQEVKDLMKANPNKLTLAGGYIRSRIANEPVNNIDLFSPTKELAHKWAHELINAKYEVGQTNNKIHTTDNAYSVRLKSGLFVQFIHRWTFDKPENVVPSFDFTIAQAAIWYGRVRVPSTHAPQMNYVDENFKECWTSLCSDRFYQDLAAKRLTYTQPIRNEDAGGSILRVLKFYQRGYRIPLPSLSEVIARLVKDIDFDEIKKSAELNRVPEESWLATVIFGLLREVDPNTPID